MDINVIAITGRLVRDIEIKYTQGGLALGTFSIASNYSQKKDGEWNQEANFFDCKIFGKTVESIGKYLVKGKEVAVTGVLRQERWEKDGEKRSKIVILVNDVKLGGGGEKGAPVQSQGPYTHDMPQGEIFNDDVPF